MSSSFCLLLLVAVLGESSGGRSQYSRTVRYDDEVFVKCPTDAPGVMNFIQRDDVDLWTIRADGTADVRIKEALFASADVRSVCSTVGNVEHLVQLAENATFPVRKPDQPAEWFEEYHTYDDIVKWYEELAMRHSDFVTFEPSIGISYEGRDMPAVHIGIRVGARLTIYYQCQIHAREWISGATCMYVADYLATKYSENDQTVVDLLEKVKFVFVPFVNPDGYEYTWTNDRMWRKNRRINSGSSCDGVDLNRNYPDHWSESGSSSNPCSETYHGSSAASEPETENTIKHFKQNVPVIGAVDWHSYSQLIMRPYGWTSGDTPDEARLKQLGEGMSNEIYEVHGTRYTAQKAIGLYPTSGTARDWFYGAATDDNQGYRAAGHTIELRDTGRYGFLLPPDQIIPTGQEIAAGVLYFAKNLADDPII